MFYPFVTRRGHTTPLTHFHLPRPQVAIVEKWEFY